MSNSSKFDKVLNKLNEFKVTLEKTYGGADAINNKMKKYYSKRQDGANVDAPMTAREINKAGEVLAMSKNGQWSLDKNEKVGKKMPLTPEKESPHNDPKGEPYAGSGKDRMGKSEAEPHKDDPHHEAKEKKIGQKVKQEAQDLIDMHKKEEACKMDDGTTMNGPVGIEKKDLPKDAEYQVHTKEPKDMGKSREDLIESLKKAAAPISMKPEPLTIGKHSNGKFKGYSWKAGRVVQKPEEFDTHEQAKAHFEGKGHAIKG